MGVFERLAKQKASSSSGGVFARLEQQKIDEAEKIKKQDNDDLMAELEHRKPVIPKEEQSGILEKAGNFLKDVNDNIHGAVDAFGNTITFGLANKLSDKLGLSNEQQNTLGGKVGRFGGEAVNAVTAYKLAGKGLVKLAPKLSRTKKLIATGATAGAGYQVAKEAADLAADTRNNGDESLGQRSLNVAGEAALFAGGDLALRGVAKSAKAIADKTGLTPKIKKTVQSLTSRLKPAETNKAHDIQPITPPKSTIGDKEYGLTIMEKYFPDGHLDTEKLRELPLEERIQFQKEQLSAEKAARTGIVSQQSDIGGNTIKEATDALKTNADDFLSFDPMEVKDLKGITGQSRDIYRNLEATLGPVSAKPYIESLNAAKKENIDMQEYWLNRMKTEVVDKLGIQKGSKLSALVQKYGEHQIDIKQLKDQAPNDWEKVVEADKWFREAYDNIIDRVNESRKLIYGDVQKKIKDIEQEISELSRNLESKTADRVSLQQGRPFKTNKEIRLAASVDRMKNSVSNLESKLLNPKSKPETNEIYKDKISNLRIKIDLKEKELRKSGLYGQPTQKQFDKVDNSIKRLEELITSKKELLESEELWRNKIVPKRKDYYRHFRDLNGLSGLKNLFETPAQISPKLEGISEFTKPKSKFASFMQKRGLGEFKNDAVGGFLNYIPSAAHSTHIDPQIEVFRSLAKSLSDVTETSKNANKLIRFLEKYANLLAGKSHDFDRAAMDWIPGGRKTMGVLRWINNRVKANTILGNIGSLLAQVGNVPNGIAATKQHAISGLNETMANIFGKGSQDIKNSAFLKERYFNTRKFDTRWIDQPKKLAAWAIETADRIGTEFIWNSAHAQGLANKVADPIAYADDLTRKLVAGRGVGEVPLMQESVIFQVLAPFTLEVGNAWRVMGDFVKKKDAGALMTLFVGSYMFNKVMEEIRGSGVVFDPIQATVDAAEPGLSPLERSGRLVGEVLSNVPLGQQVASLYPEYGKNFLGLEKIFGDLPTRDAVFGDKDPTRFGTGLALAKAFENPIKYALLPFGGNQLDKSIQGVQAIANEGHEKDGKLRFPINRTPGELTKALLLGPNATSAGKEYYDNDRRPLTEKQTVAYKSLPDEQKQEAYIDLMKRRLEDNARRIASDEDLTEKERKKKIAALQRKFNEIKKKYGEASQ